MAGNNTMGVQPPPFLPKSNANNILLNIQNMFDAHYATIAQWCNWIALVVVVIGVLHIILPRKVAKNPYFRWRGYYMLIGAAMFFLLVEYTPVIQYGLGTAFGHKTVGPTQAPTVTSQSANTTSH